jgi:NhaP-type Na+/H+ or K+/H+ antiporter
MVSFQKIEFILLGVIVLFALLIVRYCAIILSTYHGGFERDDKQTMAVMMPRGLAAAILAINFGPDFVKNLMPGVDGFFKDSVFVVILGTAMICTVGVSIIAHFEMKKQSENIEKTKQDTNKSRKKN